MHGFRQAIAHVPGRWQEIPAPSGLLAVGEVCELVGRLLGGQVGELAVGHQRPPRRLQHLDVPGRQDGLLSPALSDQVGKLTENRDGLCESLTSQRGKVFLDRHGWFFQACSMLLRGGAHDVRSQVELIREKRIGGLRFDAVWLERLGGKVLQVGGHDDVGAAPDRRRENMNVAGVRQRQRGDEGLVAGDQTVPDVRVHQVADSLNLRPGNVRMVFDDVSSSILRECRSSIGRDTGRSRPGT
jgi:hypothetical protein